MPMPAPTEDTAGSNLVLCRPIPGSSNRPSHHCRALNKTMWNFQRATYFHGTRMPFISMIFMSASPRGSRSLRVDAAHPSFGGFSLADLILHLGLEFDTATTISLFKEIGATILRFPGARFRNEYHWSSTRGNTWTWATSFATLFTWQRISPHRHSIYRNYGSGTSAEAASWVATRCDQTIWFQILGDRQ